jgi:hypothetical protein
MQEVIDFANEGREVCVLPVVTLYGPKPKPPIWFLRRRTIDMHVLAPIDVRGRSADDVLAEIKQRIVELWPAPKKVEAPEGSSGASGGASTIQ